MELQCYKNQDEQKLIHLLEPFCEKLGFELVDVEWTGDRRLIVYAQRNGGSMSIDDCAELSELISRYLDVEDPIDKRYTLEVSSPGMERPLRRLKDFVEGCRVRVKLLKSRPLRLPGKVPQYNIVGSLKTVAPDGLLVIDQELGESRIFIQDIERAHRVVNWDSEENAS